MSGETIPDDFVGRGYLLHLNRTWAHPLGFEVAVSRGGQVLLRDWRLEPREPVYGDAMPADAAAKLDRIDALWADRAAVRRDRLGSVLEPVPGREPSADCSAVIELADGGAPAAVRGEIGAGVAEAIETLELALGEEMPADLRAWLLRVMPVIAGRIVSRTLYLVAVGPDGIAYLDAERVAATEREAAVREARGEIWREIRAIGRAVLHGREDRAPVHHRLRELSIGDALHEELYDGEVEELRGLLAEATGLEAREREGEDVSSRRDAIGARMHALWALAQPGMRYWRGDRQARARFEGIKASFREAVDLALVERGEYRRLLLGEIPPEDLEHPEEALARLEEEARDLRAQIASATKTREEALGRLDRLEGLQAALAPEHRE